MARPVKTGLDYFSLDVNLDDDVELMEADCGLEGFAILIKLWQKIYSEGYYIQWKEDNAMLFSRKINTEVSKINSVVIACLSRSIFDSDLYERYKILTSKGIQKRYLTACKQSKRTVVPFVEAYQLVNPEFIGIVSEFLPDNSGESTQRKGKERKEKGNREEIESKEPPMDIADGQDAMMARIGEVWEKSGYGSLNINTAEKLLADCEMYTEAWVMEAISIGNEKSARNYAYMKAILTSWQTKGKDAPKPTYTKGKEVKPDFTERQYDYSELEKKLLGRE